MTHHTHKRFTQIVVQTEYHAKIWWIWYAWCNNYHQTDGDSSGWAPTTVFIPPPKVGSFRFYFGSLWTSWMSACWVGSTAWFIYMGIFSLILDIFWIPERVAFTLTKVLSIVAGKILQPNYWYETIPVIPIKTWRINPPFLAGAIFSSISPSNCPQAPNLTQLPKRNQQRWWPCCKWRCSLARWLSSWCGNTFFFQRFSEDFYAFK